MGECAALRVEVDRLNERTKESEEQSTAAESARVAALAQLEIKERHVKVLQTSNIDLRAEASAAKSDAEKAIERAKEWEDGLCAAQEREADLRKEWQSKLDEVSGMKVELDAAHVDLAREVGLREEAETKAAAAREKEA